MWFSKIIILIGIYFIFKFGIKRIIKLYKEMKEEIKNESEGESKDE